MEINKELFSRPPLESIDGIPVFSVSDRYTKNYAKIAADHLAAMAPGADNPFIENELWECLEESTRELIKKYIRPGCRVLDAGVGLGRVLAPFKEDAELYGIDISIDYLSKARDAGFGVAYARIDDMPFKDSTFDMVVACDVLEHVIDLEACCKALLKVLKPGGALIVRVPNMDDLAAYLDESLPYEFIHVRSFDLSSLRLLFQKIHGMRYVEHLYVAPWFKDTLMKVRLLPIDSRLANLAREATGPDHPLWMLSKVTAVSNEEYRNWLFALKTDNPTMYAAIAGELLEGLEINVVFTKPT